MFTRTRSFFNTLYEINPVHTFSHIIYLRCILILFSHVHLSTFRCVDLVRYSSRSSLPIRSSFRLLPSLYCANFTFSIPCTLSSFYKLTNKYTQLSIDHNNIFKVIKLLRVSDLTGPSSRSILIVVSHISIQRLVDRLVMDQQGPKHVGALRF